MNIFPSALAAICTVQRSRDDITGGDRSKSWLPIGITLRQQKRITYRGRYYTGGIGSQANKPGQNTRPTLSTALIWLKSVVVIFES
jgi:hypothetical protein